ncbi:MAG: hypothetical protein KBB54_01315 [Candidatus Pacebacteria bacterium]|nr:hypothetical protein [Candidatus Paceibacterota bacterium]MDQ5950010.1 hypothetical protein [Patescibacteria group bacterium]
MNKLLNIGDKFSFKENVSGCILYQVHKNMVPYDNGAFYIGANENSFYSPQILGPVENFSSKDEFIVLDTRDEHTCINIIYTIAERTSDKKQYILNRY